MADGERQKLVWSIKKTLLTLSVDELFQIAKSTDPVPRMDQSRVKSTDEEGCFEYMCSFMSSEFLLGLEDTGMAHLLALREVIDTVIRGRNPQVLVTTDTHDTNPSNDSASTDVGTASATHMTLTTADDTHDIELQKILSSYEELSKKIM